MIAVLGALRDELRGIHKQLHLEETPGQHTWRSFRANYANKEILLVHTGIGREKAEAATEFILRHYPVTTLISLGFAGALAEGLEAGDLVLCQSLLETAGSAACHSDPELVATAAETAEETAVRLISGSSVTAGWLVTNADAKAALGSAFSAQAVDMEGYWIARIALARQVAFLAVRAISDTLNQSLPPLDQFFGINGEWLQKDALRFFLTSPKDLAKLPRIYMNARRARKSLTRFFCACIPKLQGGQSKKHSLR